MYFDKNEPHYDSNYSIVKKILEENPDFFVNLKSSFEKDEKEITVKNLFTYDSKNEIIPDGNYSYFKNHKDVYLNIIAEIPA